MDGGLAAASSGMRGGDVALTRPPRRAAWSRGTWRLPAAPGTQTCSRVRGARAADRGAWLGSLGMPGPERFGGAGSGGWEGLQGGHLRDPLLGERPPGGPGPAPLAWDGPPPGLGTPVLPPPRRAPSSPVVFTSKETFPDLSGAATLQPTASSPPTSFPVSAFGTNSAILGLRDQLTPFFLSLTPIAEQP